MASLTQAKISKTKRLYLLHIDVDTYWLHVSVGLRIVHIKWGIIPILRAYHIVPILLLKSRKIPVLAIDEI